MRTWEDGTFDGATRAREREIALMSAAERVAWLAAAQRLAAATGALQGELERRAAAQLQKWHDTSGTE